jgi:cell division protein FtsW
VSASRPKKATTERDSATVARYVLMGAVLVLALGGLVMVYSASAASDFSRYADSAYQLKKQALFLVVGLAGMWFCSRLPMGAVRRLGWWVLGLSDAALLMVLIVGYAVHGATSWLDIGGFRFQPSEFAKLGCMLAVAAVFADRGRHPRPIKEDLPTLALIVLPVVALVLAQPDMGTATAIVIPIFLLAFVGGLEWTWVLGTGATLAAGLTLALYGQAYRAERVAVFLDPETDPLGKGYQIIQAMLAFGSGGLTGLGLGLSRQKYFYLPEAQTDFIFAIIGEELGLLGTLGIVAAFAAFAWAGFRIAATAKDRYSRLVAAGLTIMVVVQAVMNMAAVTRLVPVTGIPLPFVSAGGSSMLFTMGCVGLILAVARQGRGRAARSDRSGGVSEERDGARTGERGRDRRAHLSVVDGGKPSSRRRAL